MNSAKHSEVLVHRRTGKQVSKSRHINARSAAHRSKKIKLLRLIYCKDLAWTGFASEHERVPNRHQCALAPLPRKTPATYLPWIFISQQALTLARYGAKPFLQTSEYFGKLQTLHKLLSDTELSAVKSKAAKPLAVLQSITER